MTPRRRPVPGIPGAEVAQLQEVEDERGGFCEVWRAEWFPGMVQANRSRSRAGVLRGMHYHLKQADLWRVESGHAVALLADLRGLPASPPRAVGIRMHPGSLLYIPRGVAHGYYAVSEVVLHYLVDATYDPADELGVRWDSLLGDGFDVPGEGPAAIPGVPLTSPRDAALPAWGQVAPEARAALDALPR